LILALSGLQKTVLATPSAGLAGSYTVGSPGGFTAPDFTAISAAIDSLYAVGMSGNVTFELLDQTFYERVVLNADSIPNYDSTRTITFRAFSLNVDDARIRHSSTSASDNGTFVVIGVDNLTIRDLIIENRGSSYSTVVDIQGGSDHVSIINNTITSINANASSFNKIGIKSGNSIDQYLVIDSNRILRNSIGIYLTSSSSKRESGNKLRYNVIDDFCYIGIYTTNQDSLQIIGNVIEDRGNRSVVNSIHTQVCYYGSKITDNKIINHSTSSAYGILAEVSYNNSSNKSYIYNNSISLLSSNGGTARGIGIQSCAYVKVYHNNIYINTPISSTNGAGIYVKGTSSYKFNEIVNNIVYCENGGYAVHFDATAASSGVVSVMNNNNLYSNAPNFGFYGSAAVASFAAWKTASSKDTNSTNLNPHYEKDTILAPQALLMNDKGSNVSIANDLAGVLRSTTKPDIGCYEYDPPVPSPDYGDATGSGNALDFDSSNNYVNIPVISGQPAGSSARTVEAWFKTNATGQQYLLSFAGVSNGKRFSIKTDSASLGIGLFGYARYYSAAVNDGKWHHVAVSMASGDQLNNIKIYFDGVLLTTVSATVSSQTAVPNTTSSANFRIGSVGFNGQLDEIRVWNTNLSETTIRKWMSKKLTDSHALINNLKAYYRMDQSTGTTLYDLKGGNHGTLTNMTNADWITSGASLGDESSSSYGSMAVATLSSGSSLTAKATSGFSSTEGIQVYKVNAAPNSLIKPVGVDSILGAAGYFGVHKAAASADAYSVTLNYSGLNLSKVEKDKLVLLKRDNDKDSTWEVVSSRLDNKVSSNSISITGQTGTQYVLGFSNTSYPARPGSGYALEFDGTNDYIETTSNTSLDNLGANNITMEAWVYPTSATGARSIIRKNGDYNFFTQGGDLYAEVWPNTGINSSITRYSGSVGPDLNTWSHVSFTWDGTTPKLYINGVSVTFTTSTGSVTDNGEILAIGKSITYSDLFVGKMDELKIWKTALSETHIRDWMCKKLTSSHPKSTDLVSYFRFDEASGDSLYNLAGTNHGKLTNMDTSTAWKVSGAAIGDSSIYTTSLPGLLDLSHMDGDKIRYSTAGSHDMVQLYLVNEPAINYATSDPTRLKADTSRHWGMFVSGSDGSTHIMSYYYNSNSNLSAYNEPSLIFFQRANGSDTDWTASSFTTTRNTTTNILKVSGISNNFEFMAGQGATEVYGGMGNALEFDGSNDYVTVADNGTSDFDITGDMAVSAWVYFDDVSGTKYIINKASFSSSAIGDYSLSIQGIKARFSIYTTSGWQHNFGTSILVTGRWYHIVGLRDGGNIKMYVDGQLENTVAIAGTVSSSNNNDVQIGRMSSGQAASSYFNGKLDEIQIWSKSLNVDEIGDSMNQRISVPQTNLVAYYNSDSKDGATQLNDISGNENHCTFNNMTGNEWKDGPDSLEFKILTSVQVGDTIAHGTAWDFNGSTISYKWVDGDTANFEILNTGVVRVKSGSTLSATKYYARYEVTEAGENETDTATLQINSLEEGGALAFDGAGDQVLVSNDAAFEFTSGTIEMWLKPSASSQNEAFYSMRTTTGNSRYSYHINVNNNTLGIFTTSGGFQTISYTFNAGTWYHLALVLNTTNTTVYIDGNLVGALGNGMDATKTGMDLGIGSPNDAGYPTEHFPGVIDELRVWSRELCEDEIQSRLNCSLDTAGVSGLIAYYDFSNGIANGVNTGITTLLDKSGNGHNGTLSSTALSGMASNWVSQSDSVSYTSCTAFVSTNIPIVVADKNPLLYLDGNGSAAVLGSSLFTSASINCAIITSVVVSDSSFACGDAVDTLAVNSGILTFDGSNDYITLGTSSVIKPTAKITVEAWVNMSNWTGTSTFIGNANSAGYALYLMNGKLKSAVRRNGIYGFTEHATALTSGWHHLALTFDGRYSKLFLDGKLIETDDAGGTYSISYIGNATLIGAEAGGGSIPTGDYVGGKMDEIRIWNIARTENQILANYKKVLSGSESGLLAYYNFEDGSGSTLSDQSGTLNGTLTNMNTSAAWGTDDVYSYIGVPVTLTASGSNSIVSKDTVYVNVIDTILPSLTIKNYTAYINASGVATPPIDSLYSSMADNCGNLTVEILGDTSFSCDFVGNGSSTKTTTTLYYARSNRYFEKTPIVSPSASIYALAYDETIDKIFYVKSGVLKKANSDGTGATSLVTGLGTCFAMTIDAVNEFVYVADYSNSTLRKIKYDGSTNTIIISGNRYLSVWIDLINNQLYIGNYGVGSVQRSNLDGSSLTTLVTGQSNIRGITYNPNTNTIYWTRGSSGPMMKKVGTATPVTFLTGQSYPMQMAYSDVEDRIYFMDYSASQLKSVKLDGTGVTTMISGLGNAWSLSIGYAKTGGGGVAIPIRVTDTYGNSIIDTSYVNILDTISPTLSLKNDTLYVDANGNTDTLSVYDLIVSASDNCVIADSTLDSLGYFDCTQLDSNLVSVSVSDSSGNTTTEFATITILDTIKPTITHIGDTTIYLDATGNASVSAALLYSTTSDNCSSIITVSVSDTSFGCGEVIDSSNVSADGLNFDGSNDFVDLGQIATAGQFTVEAWIYPETNKLAGIVNKGACNADQNGDFQLRLNSNGKVAPHLFTSSGWKTYESANAVSLSTWTHLALVFDGTNVDLFINGVKDANGIVVSGTFTPNAISKINIGTHPNCGSTHFDGNISEVRIWNTARTVSEIKSNYNKQLTGLESGLDAYYDFSQGTGASLTDISGNGKTGTLTNFALTGTTSNWVAGPNLKRYGVPVVLTATDESGNTTNDTVYVNLIDTILPSLTVKNDTVYLNASGSATALASNLYSSTSDNCSSTNVSIVGDSTFDCSDITLGSAGGGTADEIWYVKSGTIVSKSSTTTVSNQTQFTSTVGSIYGAAHDYSIDKVFYLDRTSGQRIVKQDPNGSNFTVVTTSVQDAYLLILDPSNKRIFWADYGSRQIKKVNYDGTGYAVLKSLSANPMAVAYDEVNDVLYWSYWSSNNRVESIKSDGTSHNSNVFTISGLGTSGGIAVDPGTNTIYVAGRNGNIYKKVGTATHTTLISGLSNIWGIDLDRGNQKIYYARQNINVGSVKTDGTSNTVLISGGFTNNLYVSLSRGAGGTGSGTALKQIVISATDAANNKKIDTAYVTVLDTIKPTLTAFNDTTYLNAQGLVILDSTNLVPGGLAGTKVSDNCALASLWYSEDTLNISNLGANNITIYLSDSSGNIDSVIRVLYIVDSLPPFAGLGRALDFDGTTQSVDVSTDILGTTGSFTLEAWFKPDTVNVFKNILLNGKDGFGAGWNVSISIQSNSLMRGSIVSASSVQFNVIGTTSLIKDKWHHVAFSLNSTNREMKIYLNGELESTLIASSSTRRSSTNYFSVGNENAAGEGFNGKIDEVKIWNSVLTQSEIESNYRIRPNVTDSRLQLYLPFEGNIGDTVALDYSSNAASTTFTTFKGDEWTDAQDTLIWKVDENNAIGDTAAYAMGWDVYLPEDSITYNVLSGFGSEFTLDAISGAITHNTELNFEQDSIFNLFYTVTDFSGNKDTGAILIDVQDLMEEVAAGFASTLAFDGTNDYAKTPNQVITSNSNFTVSVWAKNRITPTGYREIVSQGGNATKWYIGRGASGEIRAGDSWGNTGVQFPTDLEWHNYTVVSSATNVELYLDGVNVAQKGSSNGATGNAPGTQFYVGVQYNGIQEYYNGKVDELKVWSRALSEDEVHYYMASRPDTSDASLKLYYNFDDQDSDTLYDLSGNGYHAAIKNMATPDYSSSVDTIITYISENTVAADTVAAPLAFDIDRSDITYQAIGGDSNLFAINAATGYITAKATALLDFETDSMHYLHYAVTENGDNDKDSVWVRINLKDDNDAPLAGLTGAIDFDGVSDYIDLGDLAAVEGISEITYGAWIKPTDFGGGANTGRSIIAKHAYTGGFGDASFYIYYRQGGTITPGQGYRFSAGISTSSSVSGITTDAFYTPLNEWVHVMFTWKSGETSKLYINGEIHEASSTAVSGTINNSTSSLRIGSSNWGGEQKFKGSMDEVVIYNRRLTGAEVKQAAFQRPQGDESGLVLAYNGEFPSSGKIRDLSPNGNNGTLVSMDESSFIAGHETVLVSTAENRSVGDTIAYAAGYDFDNDDMLTYYQIGNSSYDLDSTSGSISLASGFSLDYEIDTTDTIIYRVVDQLGLSDTSSIVVNVMNDTNERVYAGLGNAISLNGTSQYFNSVLQSDLNITNSFTIEAWVKPNVGESDAILFGNGNLVTDKGFSIGLRAGIPSIVFNRSSSNWSTVSAQSNVVNGIWNHVAATYDGTNLKIYVNGVEEYDNPVSRWTDNTQEFKIGSEIVGHTSDSIYDKYSGLLSELRVWNIVRDSNQIVNNYRVKIDENSSGLVAYYNMNVGINSLEDLSSLNNNSSFVNITHSDFVNAADTLRFEISESLINGDTAAYAIGWDLDYSPLTYKILSGNTDTTFEMNALTGVLKVYKENELNFYQDSTYYIEYEVTEGGDLNIDTATIIVDLINENGFPTISSIANDTICAGSIGDSLIFYINDIDLYDSLRMTLRAYSLDTSLIPNDSVYFFNDMLTFRDSARALRINLPYVDTNTTVPVWIIVEDEGGLGDSTLIQVEINSVNIAFTVDSIKPLCSSDTIGKLTTVTAGGTAGYIYAWNDSRAQTDSIATKLMIGEYAVTVTDSRGCIDSNSASLSAHDTLRSIFTFSDTVICNKDTSRLLLGLPANDGVFSGNGVTNNRFNPNVLSAGSYIITYTRTERSCIASATDTIRLNPNPVAAIGNLGSICTNTPDLLLGVGSPVGGYFYGNNIGLDSLTYNPSNQVVNDIFNYVFTNQFGCADSIFKVVGVDTIPTVLASSASNVCLDATPFALTNGSPKIGGVGVYSETAKNSVVGNKFFPSITGVGTANIQYRFTQTSTGCSDSITFALVVDSLPILRPNLFGDLCVNDTSLTLDSVWAPYQSNYIGNGVSTIDSLTFDPAIAGVGTHIIGYSFTDLNSCKTDTQFSIVVRPKPIIVFNALSDVCADADTFALTAASPYGGTYYGPGIINDTNFLADSAIVGSSNTLKYFVANQYGCIDTATGSIIVDTIPVVFFNLSLGSICFNEEFKKINFGNPKAINAAETGIYSGSGIRNDSIITAISGTGLFNITYAFTDTNGCSASIMDTLRVHGLPLVTLSAFNPVCEVVDTVHLNGGFPLNGIYTSIKNTVDTLLSGQQYLNTLSPGGTIDTITYTYSDGNNCTASASQAFNINALPAVTFNLPATDTNICHGGNSVALSGGVPFGGIFNNSDNRVSNNNYLSDTNTTRNDTISYTYTDANGCTNSDTDYIHIDSIPLIVLRSIPTFCAADDSVQLSVGIGNGFYTGQRGLGADSLSFLPYSAKAGTHLVTYNLENLGCFSSETFSIVVHPQPIVNLPSFTGVCENLDTFYLTGGTPVGSSINSSYKGSGVQNGYFDPSLVGVGNTTVWYLYENSFGCIDSASNTMEIKATPIATFSPLDTIGYCENSDTVHLGSKVGPKGAAQYQAVFKGKGIVLDSIFDPSIAGSGVHELWFIVNDTNGCSDSTSEFALVNSLPLVSLNAINDICENGTSFTLSGGSQTSFNGTLNSKYTLDSNVLVPNVFFPANYAASNSYKVTYTFTDTVQCSDSASRVFTVLAKPIVQLFDSTLKFCSNEGPYQLVEGFPKTGGSGIYSGNNIFSGTFFPQFSSVGIDTLRYTFTATNGCVDTALTDSIQLKHAPVIQVSSTLKYCDKDGIDTLNFAINTTGNGYGIYSGTGVTNDSIFNVDSAGVGVHNIQVAYFDSSFGYTCADSSTHVITVNAAPTVAIQSTSDLCLNATQILGFGFPQGGVYYTDTLQSANKVAMNRYTAAGSAQSQKIIYQYYDANRCWDTASTFIGTLPLPSVSFALGDSITCYSESLVKLSGGSPSGGTYLGKGIFQNQLYTQSSGTGYLDIVYEFTDSNNCNNTDTAKLLVAADPILNVSNDTVLCANTLANLFATGAGKGALYAWSNGVQNPNISITPLKTASYSVVGLDTNGCSDQKMVEIEVLPEIIVTTSGQNAGCSAADGIANVSVAGGLPPFSYLWTSGSKNSIATGLMAGFYEVTVTDANVCNKNASVAVKNTNGPNVVVNGITNASCAGVADGAIALDIQGAVLAIQWSNGANTEDISGLSPGKYILTVTAADSCITIQEFTITAPNAMQIAALVEAPNCTNNNGFVTLSVVGGKSPYRYDWSNSTSNDTLLSVTSGVYQVTVTDDNSCKDSLEVVVSDSGAPVISLIKVIQPDCGVNNGELHIDVNKDILTHFSWNTGDSTYIIKNLVHGIYRATATDTAGCRGLTSITLNSITPRAKELCVATVDTATGLSQIVWSNTGAKEIEIYTKALGRDDYSVLGSTPVNPNIYTDSLSSIIFKSYSYAIKSTDSCGGVSELSSLHQTMLLTSQLEKNNDIILRWTAYAGFKFSEYEIMRVENGVMTEYGRAGIGTNEIIITGEEFGSRKIFYVVRVAAPESCGPTNYYDYSWSNKSLNFGSFNINVEHPGNMALRKVYPNPNGGQFTLQMGFNAEVDVEIHITDMSGREVWNTNLNQVFGVITLPINLLNNAAGVYQMSIEVGREVFMERIQVTR